MEGKYVYIVGNICLFFEISDKKIFFYFKIKLNLKVVVIRVIIEFKKSIFYGDIVKVFGKFKILKGKINRFGFDYREYLKGKGVIYIFYLKDVEVIF